MESRLFLFTVIPLLGIIVVFSYLNIQQNQEQEQIIQSPETEEKCKSILYNGEDRIDLLFISTEEEAKHYTNYMFTVEPYKSKKDYFNVWAITDEKAECESYKGIAVLCSTPETKRIAKQCPNDYTIVIVEDSPKIRSSAYEKVISINKVHEDEVIIHELGHAFGNLAEEYGGAKLPRDSLNCQSSCNNFKGEIDSCQQECSLSTYYRSIPAGVMRTLATANYGIYNIALLTELLEKNKPKDTTITGNLISDSINECNQNIMAVEIQGSEVKTDYTSEEGCTSDKGLAGQLCIDDICNINTLFTDAQDIESEETIQGETFTDPEIPIILYIPQNPLSPLVQITLNEEIIGTINTAQAGATACQI